jgi:hypothetical protein
MKPIKVTTNEKRNGFHIESDFTRARLHEWMKEYRWFEIKPYQRESRKQRGFYHGAICALYAYFHENLDHHNPDDIQKVHEWLKIEFNGEYVVIGDKSHKIGKTTQGELNLGFLERCINNLIENYGLDDAVLETDRYKNWRDTVFPHGGPDNYIDYLVDIKLLRKQI